MIGGCYGFKHYYDRIIIIWFNIQYFLERTEILQNYTYYLSIKISLPSYIIKSLFLDTNFHGFRKPSFLCPTFYSRGALCFMVCASVRVCVRSYVHLFVCASVCLCVCSSCFRLNCWWPSAVVCSMVGLLSLWHISHFHSQF